MSHQFPFLQSIRSWTFQLVVAFSVSFVVATVSVGQDELQHARLRVGLHVQSHDLPTTAAGSHVGQSRVFPHLFRGPGVMADRVGPRRGVVQRHLRPSLPSEGTVARPQVRHPRFSRRPKRSGTSAMRGSASRGGSKRARAHHGRHRPRGPVLARFRQSPTRTSPFGSPLPLSFSRPTGLEGRRPGRFRTSR
eukprot:scaffold519_cov331-Pavlova_lutheri.AAC.29